MPERIETIIVDGLALAQEIRKELSEAVGRHVAAGRRAPKLSVAPEPCVCALSVDDGPAFVPKPPQRSSESIERLR